MEENEDAPKAVVLFDRGEEIRIIDGPFASMNGKVEEVNQLGSTESHGQYFWSAHFRELEFTQVERLG